MQVPFAGRHLTHRTSTLLALILVAALLELAAGTGLAYLAGFSRVRAVLGDFDLPWLAVGLGALAVSSFGYAGAYWGIFRVESGPSLPGRQFCSVAAAGFGGFLANGGGTLERYALETVGAEGPDARARLAGLAGLEQGVLALGACGTAIAVLVSNSAQPAPDFTIPWAVIPVPGFLLAFWLAERYRDRLRGQNGWRGAITTFLTSVHLIRVLVTRPWPWGPAFFGMAVFWAADSFAVWSALAAFGFRMSPATFFVGFSTGMIFTRRTAPLAGAGILALVLPLTIWNSGAPFAVAVVSVFTYRLLCVLLALPISLAARPTLKEMDSRFTDQDPRNARQ
jgi:hypothetical protein